MDCGSWDELSVKICPFDWDCWFSGWDKNWVS